MAAITTIAVTAAVNMSDSNTTINPTVQSRSARALRHNLDVTHNPAHNMNLGMFPQRKLDDYNPGNNPSVNEKNKETFGNQPKSLSKMNPSSNSEIDSKFDKNSMKGQQQKVVVSTHGSYSLNDHDVLNAAAGQMMSNLNQSNIVEDQFHRSPVLGSNKLMNTNSSVIAPAVNMDSPNGKLDAGYHDEESFTLGDSVASNLTLSASNLTDSDINNSSSDHPPMPVLACREPWSLVKPGVFPVFWRVVYWTSQILTW